MHTQIRCPSYSRFSLRGLASIVVAGLSMFGAHPATAAKVYRCGNVFQDQPCSGEVKAAEVKGDVKAGDVKAADAKTVDRPSEKSRDAAAVAAEPARPVQEVTKVAVRTARN